ncbi:MAG: tRNA (adenosine(37)-N6)-threonylcarbamoyltransferase complex dimerization subunit type 1 TsaB [Gammaproteobacteria bacterium]|jgi:tRNA threonylcarbamoyladenosine biosynthesis protein TsaB|nr:tRNA (adenosine(37)-N6)-threonylcarbamoyltransferase complex dimerization subunit type 1 TsaB [Gammaproteobacteria bacterium]
MSIILAIDTSTEACSCALNAEGSVSELFEIIPRQHANQLLPMIKKLLVSQNLSFADLDAVAYGQGPGSFTGLRIAAGVTQGLAYGLGLSAIPVSSLASLAFQVKSEIGKGLAFCTLDARIDEVYWGFYGLNDGNIELVGKEGLCKPEILPVELVEKSASILGAGSGMNFQNRMPEAYRDQIHVLNNDLYPRAGAIAALAGSYYDLGKVQAPEQVQPVYLRDKVTHS